MEVKKCPRCGEDMEFNPLVMDYMCHNCKMLERDVFERVLSGDMDFGYSNDQRVKRMMDTVNDEF